MRSSLGEALRELRRRARLSQAELAATSGVSRATISLVERGATRPTPSTLEQLARGLATDADGVVDPAAQQQAFVALLVGAGYPLASADPPNRGAASRPSGQDRVAEVLARHPSIRVAFAQVGELDEDDAEMIVQVVEYVARRSAEKRPRGGPAPGNASD
jgi:transcriptional regulator with XRE-family HTH domain